MSTRSDLEQMRAFVAALMTGARDAPEPPAELVRRNALEPLAFRRGMIEFRGDYAASLIMAERRAALMAEVAAAMGARGVRVAPIKGMALAGWIYPDAAERPMMDIDLLVRQPRFVDAIACMRDLGFRRGGEARKLSGYHHAIVFVRHDMMVELHRNIMQHGRTAMHMRKVWARAAPDPSVPGLERLAPEDTLLYCLLHIARSELAEPVLNYVDVARLLRAVGATGRARVLERARAYRVGRAVDAALSMTELLEIGASGRPEIPGGRILPRSDDVLLGVRPRRARQLAQKLLLTEGPREWAGLARAYVTAAADGLRRGR
ncbi:MAG TPA: nucleotidyltransferase family protein [Kofleriaceae bacterium]|nr:nucleotidyltransferase family protein [Kofleriaceae bacterium]